MTTTSLPIVRVWVPRHDLRATLFLRHQDRGREVARRIQHGREQIGNRVDRDQDADASTGR
jgi:hypothetical protein